MEAGVHGQGEGKGEVPADITLRRIGLIGGFAKQDISKGKKGGQPARRARRLVLILEGKPACSELSI